MKANLEKYANNKPPKVLQIDITNKCNLSCIYCSRDTSNCLYELKYDYIDWLLSQAEEWGVKKIILSGGEPLLHSSFYNILEIFESYSLNLGIDTNAFFLSENVIKK